MNDLGDFLDSLILEGALEPTAIDSDSGEILYSFTDKLKEVDPMMYKLIMSDFHTVVMSLWQRGFLMMDVENENPLVMVTEKAFDSQAVAELSSLEQSFIKEIIRLTRPE